MQDGDQDVAIEAEARADRRRWLRGAVLVIGLTLLAGVLFASQQGGPEGSSDRDNWDLPALGSEGRVRLKDFRGSPVVLNVFASWCGPCEFELPHFARISREYQGRIVFVGVNSQDGPEGFDMAQRFGIDHWPLAADIGSGKSDLHRALGGLGMPTTAFYDERGKLLDVAAGALSEPALRKRIADLYGL